MGVKLSTIPPWVPVLLVWIFYSHPPVIFGNLPIKYHDALREWDYPIHSGSDALMNFRALPRTLGHAFKGWGCHGFLHTSPQERTSFGPWEVTFVFLFYLIDSLNQRKTMRNSSIHGRVNIFVDELTWGLNLVPYDPVVGSQMTRDEPCVVIVGLGDDS